MSTIREQKEQVVNEIRELIENSKSVVVVNYQGINVEEDTELRKIMRENNVQYKVLKNTMVNLAMEGRDVEGFAEYLNGPNSFLFAEDEVTGAKLMKKFIKDKKKLEIKAGFVDGHVLTAAEVDTLAEMPSKEELIQKLLGSFKSPVSNFVYLLNAVNPAQSFTYLVKAIADQKAEA